MIDQLAIDYADSNIVFVDYTMDWGIPNPVLYRWEVIERTAPGWGLTWAMIDSGQMYSRGVETHEEAVEKYTEMVEYGIAQEALADINATYWVEGETAFFKVNVTNLSGKELSPANTARVYAFVKETGIQYEDTNTTHHASRGEGMTLIPHLADQETGTYYISVPLRTITNWDNVGAYAFVDMETEPGGLFIQLNAAPATKVELTPTISVEPTRINLTIQNNETPIPTQDISITTGDSVNWSIETNRAWLTPGTLSGQGSKEMTLDISTITLRTGENRATMLIRDLDSGALASVEVNITVKEVISRIYFPTILK